MYILDVGRFMLWTSIFLARVFQPPRRPKNSRVHLKDLVNSGEQFKKRCMDIALKSIVQWLIKERCYHCPF